MNQSAIHEWNGKFKTDNNVLKEENFLDAYIIQKKPNLAEESQEKNQWSEIQGNKQTGDNEHRNCQSNNLFIPHPFIATFLLMKCTIKQRIGKI